MKQTPIQTLVAGCEQMLMQNDFDSAVYEVNHYLKDRAKILTELLRLQGVGVDEKGIIRFLTGETNELGC
jgi:hypothetical protein